MTSFIHSIHDSIAHGLQTAVHAIPTPVRNRLISWGPSLLNGALLCGCLLSPVPIKQVLLGALYAVSQTVQVMTALNPPLDMAPYYLPKYDKKKPPLLILKAEHDHNGAFDPTKSQNKSMLSQLAKTHQLTFKSLRYSWDVGYFVEQFAKKHRRRIPVIVMAHGQPNSMVFSNEAVFGDYTKDLVKSGDFDGAEWVVLDSCSTGAEDGIGKKIAEVTPGTLVYAPQRPSNGLIIYWDVKNEMKVIQINSNSSSVTRRYQFLPSDLFKFEKPFSDQLTKSELFDWLENAAKRGNTYVCERLGDLYTKELDGWSTAIEWYEKAALAGAPFAQWMMGHVHEFGLGRKLDLDKSIYWYTEAAMNGWSGAQCHLAKMHTTGENGVERNLQKAFRWYERAAKDGYPLAQRELGHLYLTGKGVPRDIKKALEMFQKAADKGDSGAQSQLGLMHLHGVATKRDPETAFHWLELASKQGDKKAQIELGWLYQQGKGVARDPKKAEEWFEKGRS
jgi:TPR repeat protein